jgi:peptidoglycan DL-endopeptidase CwlO
MHGGERTLYQRNSGGGIWLVAAAALLAPGLALSLLAQVTTLAGQAVAAVVQDLPTVARSSPPHSGGRATRPSPRAARAVSFALAQQGKPYRWAAEGPHAFDCSGLTWAAWRSAGVAIPRTAAAQVTHLPRAHGRLRPGDLVIYRTNGPSRRHVAMVVGRGRMVEARGRGIPVRVTALRGGWLGAVRPGGRP